MNPEQSDQEQSTDEFLTIFGYAMDGLYCALQDVARGDAVLPDAATLRKITHVIINLRKKTVHFAELPPSNGEQL